MKNYLIINVFSLSLISLAQAAELSGEEQCQALGYETKISECEKAGSAALICPLNNGSSDMAVCITDSCRGYPLYKKSGKFYYQDQAGNEVEAVPSKGQITDYMEGSFETCVAGYGDNAVTYYRVPKCKGEALYNNYFCDVGCDTEKKYPYTYHPGNTAGTVQKCVTADQTYYGYSSCNKGWVGGWSSSSGVGKCGLDDCEMVDYPYPDEPNAYHYGENRGKTETCKIGGAVYYRYTECNGSDFVLKGVNTSDKQGTICARKCPVTNCTVVQNSHTYPNKDTAVISDWSCKIDSRCTIGDIVTYNNKEIGVIVSMADNKVLLTPVSYSTVTKNWCEEEARVIDVPQLTTGDTSTWGKIQTRGMLLFGAQEGYSYPAAEYCSQYAPCEAGAFCSSGEWYFPSMKEIGLLRDVKYIVANSMSYRTLSTCSYTGTYGTSSENSYCYSFALVSGQWAASGKGNRIIIPYLSFEKK